MIIIGFFLFGIALPILFNSTQSYTRLRATWSRDIQYMVQPIFRMILVLIGWMMINRLDVVKAQGRPTMGLRVGWAQAISGATLGLMCSLPMLALAALCERKGLSRDLVYSTIVSGFAEEVFYRAFAFGLMVQVLRLRLWPAAILTGVLFGLAHLIHASVRAEPIMDQIGWIGMIAVGGLMYAWLYERAHWNLWIVIMLHAGMNLWWDTFDLTSSSMGDWGATIARILSIGLAVYFVVFRGVLGSSTPINASTIRA